MKPTIKTLKVTIAEQPVGWLLTYQDTATVYDAAVTAQKAVLKMGQELADAGISNSFIIEWIPASRIGRMVVKAIA